MKRKYSWRENYIINVFVKESGNKEGKNVLLCQKHTDDDLSHHWNNGEFLKETGDRRV